jgi:hypothetical protein
MVAKHRCGVPASEAHPVDLMVRSRPRTYNLPAASLSGLDVADIAILSEIQDNGRIANNELAFRVGISPPQCLRRRRALKARGIIKGVRALVDLRRLEYEFVLFTMIQRALSHLMHWTYEPAMEQGVYPHEGGYTNDPRDPGGPTNWGITIYDAPSTGNRTRTPPMSRRCPSRSSSRSTGRTTRPHFATTTFPPAPITRRSILG